MNNAYVVCHLIYITFKTPTIGTEVQNLQMSRPLPRPVPSVTHINSHLIITGDNFRYMITIFYKMNILLTCCKNSFAANMAIFRELSLCCWSAGKSCPRSVPSVTSTSGATEFLVFNPEWIFNYECQLVHETCRINFTDACCRHKWLCNGPLEAKNCVKMSRPLRWNDSKCDQKRRACRTIAFKTKKRMN